MDSKTLIDAISARNILLNEFDDLIFECKSLLYNNHDYEPTWVGLVVLAWDLGVCSSSRSRFSSINLRELV